MTPTPVTLGGVPPPDNTLAVFGLVVGAVGTLLAIISFFYMMNRNTRMDKKDLEDKIDKLDTRLNTLETSSLNRGDIYNRLEDQSTKIVRLETKMALLYGGIEDIVPKMLSGKFNPIHLDAIEEEAYNIYEQEKGRSPTPVLRIIEKAFDRELHTRNDIPPYEALNVFFVLQAIKAQLVDRREHVVKSEYE